MYAAWLGWTALAFGASWLAVWILIRASVRLGLIDRPNHRSLHSLPVPRGGGAGFVAVFAVLLLPASQSLVNELPPQVWRVVIAGFFVAAVGLADDRFGLAAVLRLAAQAFAAAVVAAPWIAALPANPSDETGPALVIFAILGIVAVTNFYNFMDGADGLAAGQAVLSLGVAGTVALPGGLEGLVLVCVLLAASVGGFLIHNWHPARIFMGDSGSTFLGFVFGSLAAGAVFEPALAAVPPFVWLCPLAPFLADTTITLVRRILRGERWYAAHRQHFYQRLIERGWSHRRVTGAYISAAAVLGVMSVTHATFGGTPTLLLSGCLVVIATGVGFARRAEAGQRRALSRAESLPSADFGHSLR
jgi:Fuc2NAc and GlcNAc transferase